MRECWIWKRKSRFCTNLIVYWNASVLSFFFCTASLHLILARINKLLFPVLSKYSVTVSWSSVIKSVQRWLYCSCRIDKLEIPPGNSRPNGIDVHDVVSVVVGLRSNKAGEQCEAIVRFPRLFEKYPFPILINSAFLKLGDVFRNGWVTLQVVMEKIEIEL